MKVPGYTPRPTAADVKRAVSPADFYAAELPTMPAARKGGWVNGGLCPFHADNRPGSFFVNRDSGAYKCFSCGAHGGDVFAFLMQRDGLEFRDALDVLAEWGGAWLS
jgi:DNA primase